MSSDTFGQADTEARPRPSIPRVAAADPRIRVDGRRLWLRDLGFFADDAARARLLIDRAFALDQVETVALRPERGEICVELAPGTDAGRIWRRFGELIRRGGVVVPDRASRLDLRGPTPRLPVRVTRAGTVLTTFRARALSPRHLRIGHPLLRDRSVRRRFIDLLRVVHGVSEVRSASFRPVVVVTHDDALVEAEQILRLIERAWPEIAGGAAVAPTPPRLFAAAGLLALSVVAQFYRPLLLPWATAAVVLYSLPNVIGAVRDLARGRIGLYALYTTGLGFLLWSRLPFASSVMAVLSQTWPTLARRLAAASETGLFVEHRRRLARARILDDGRGETIVDIGDLVPTSLVVVRSGEFLPADGLVIEGHAAVDEDILNGIGGASEKLPGDPVYAGTFVRDGAITLQVRRVGPSTAVAALVRSLPDGAMTGLPSSAEAERIADRNARPALAVSAALLLATRIPRLSQVVIRPDYATAPRLSAHLSALTALADAVSRGILIRRPAALDALGATEAFVFDDDLDFASRAVTLDRVNVLHRADGEEALALAAAGLAGSGDERSAALGRELDELGIPAKRAHGRTPSAGKTMFRDDAGAPVSIASPAQAIRDGFSPASSSQRALVEALASGSVADRGERALVVARDDRIVGVLQFARKGRKRFAETISGLRSQYPEARFLHVSSRRQTEAEAAAADLGLDAVFGGLDGGGKADTLRSLGLRTTWIGLGAHDAARVRAASTVSVSLGGLASLADDEADIVVLRDDPCGLHELRPVVDAHAARLAADYRVVYLANLLGVAGGFTAGFGSLGVGLTSNAGSALVFLRRWRRLAMFSADSARRSRMRIETNAGKPNLAYRSFRRQV